MSGTGRRQRQANEAQTHRISLGQDGTRVNVKVDVAVDDLEALDELADVDVGGEGGLVGVRLDQIDKQRVSQWPRLQRGRSMWREK